MEWILFRVVWTTFYALLVCLFAYIPSGFFARMVARQVIKRVGSDKSLEDKLVDAVRRARKEGMSDNAIKRIAIRELD